MKTSTTSLSGTAGVYLCHKSGRNDLFNGRRATTLRAKLERGEGEQELTALTLAGYTGFVGKDGEEWDLSGLTAEMMSR